jgi:hypothetical protein
MLRIKLDTEWEFKMGRIMMLGKVFDLGEWIEKSSKRA